MRIANFGWIDLRIQSAESTSAFAGVQFHAYSLRKKILEAPDNFVKKVIKFYKKFCNQFPKSTAHLNGAGGIELTT